MPIVINAVIVHDLHKQAQEPATVSLRGAVLPITPIVSRLVSMLHSEYARRASKSHGRFVPDEVNYPVQTFLRTYLDSPQRDFVALTSSMMQTLLARANARPSATGGHVFYAHITADDAEILMVAIVTDAASAALTEGLDVTEIIHLDLKSFRFAARVNLAGWLGGVDRYVSFLKGSSEVAEYFKEFLGCDATILDFAETYRFAEAVRDFANVHVPEEDKEDFIRRSHGALLRLAERQEPLDLTAFANEVRPDDPGPLVEVLSQPDRGLTDGYVPIRRAIQSLIRFTGKTRLWKLEFDRGAIITGDVRYNPDENSITIRNVPEALSERLRQEIHEEDER